MWKVLALSLLVTATAEAHDSTWLLCKGDLGKGQEKITLVASLFEHRSGADTRAVEVTLLFGAHVGRGTISDGSTKVKIAEIEHGKTIFTGTGDLPDTFKAFTLKGSLDPSFGSDDKPAMQKISVKLACETIRD